MGSQMLREMMFLFSSERRMMRDFMIMLLALIGALFLGAQAAVKAMAWLVPAVQTRLAEAPPPNATEAPRLYTITRSVLDDPITTGSVAASGRKASDCRN
ncbi:hypothetical protein MCEMSEM23_02481 [Rhabdaerophilaceae bacterium]